MKRFDNVELVKFPEIDEVDNALMVGHFERFLSKVPVKNEDRLILSSKEYAKGGLRKQHEIKARLILDGKAFFASTTGWQLLETTQDVLKKLEREVLQEHSSD